jgi:hypothetical protein
MREREREREREEEKDSFRFSGFVRKSRPIFAQQ